jgi:hypothetical protein
MRGWAHRRPARRDLPAVPCENRQGPFGPHFPPPSDGFGGRCCAVGIEGLAPSTSSGRAPAIFSGGQGRCAAGSEILAAPEH